MDRYNEKYVRHEKAREKGKMGMLNKQMNNELVSVKDEWKDIMAMKILMNKDNI